MNKPMRVLLTGALVISGVALAWLFGSRASLSAAEVVLVGLPPKSDQDFGSIKADPVVQLSPTFTEYGLQDTDGDGQTDSLRLGFTVNVLRAGVYRLSAVFQAPNGQQVYLSTPTDQTLQVGSQELILTLSANDVKFGFGTGGPYEVVGAAVSDERGGREVASQENMGRTKAYALSDFLSARTPWMGYVLDTGVDPDNDGVLDAIDVSFRVFITQPHLYAWSGQLLVTGPGGLSRAVASARNTGSLQAGEQVLTLRFAVSDLIAANANGPYEFDGVSVYPADLNPGVAAILNPEPFGETGVTPPMLTKPYTVLGGTNGETATFRALLDTIAAVPISGNDDGLRASLREKVENAGRQQEGRQQQAALSLLEAFRSEVRAQAGQALTPADVDGLLSQANALDHKLRR